jgi:hypothetical protein
MDKMINLHTALLDLLYEIKDTEIRLIIGGGYGIYLKDDYVRRMGIKTLFQEKPKPRSTNDMDLFLRPELLIHSDKLKPLAVAISKLGYIVIPGAENYQFVKPGPQGDEAGSIKIDILTGPENKFDGTSVITDTRRAKPKPSVGIHAHLVNEAPTLEDGLLLISLSGNLSSGKPWEGEISLPHPYTYLMMKLFAFRDRQGDTNKDYGRYHALDLYTILANTTESEWEEAKQFRDGFRGEAKVSEARKIVSEYFSGTDRFGIIRLKESPYYRPELHLTDFISAIQELFPLPT